MNIFFKAVHLPWGYTTVNQDLTPTQGVEAAKICITLKKHLFMMGLHNIKTFMQHQSWLIISRNWFNSQHLVACYWWCLRLRSAEIQMGFLMNISWSCRACYSKEKQFVFIFNQSIINLPSLSVDVTNASAPNHLILLQSSCYSIHFRLICCCCCWEL